MSLLFSHIMYFIRLNIGGADALLLESGDYLLLESGDKLLLE